MTAVSQLVPNFFGGINEQPDELKKPGQVRDCVNFLPDVTYGLIRRPGMQWINRIDTNGSGTWFEFSRENDNKQTQNYVGHIAVDGTVTIVDIDTGTDIPTSTLDCGLLDPSKLYTNEELSDESLGNKLNSTNLEYFKQSDLKLKVLNYKDSIIVANPTVPVRMNSAIIPSKTPYYAFIEATTFDKTRMYLLSVKQNETDVEEQRAVVDTTMVGVENFKGDNARDSRCVIALTPWRGSTSTIYNKDDSSRITEPLVMEFVVRGQPEPGGDRCKFSVVENRILSGGKGWRRGDEAKFEFYPGEDNELLARIAFQVKVTKVSKTNSVTEAIIGDQTDNTNAGNIKEILASTKEELEAIKNSSDDPFFSTVEIRGNGIYVESDESFLIETTEKDLWNIINSEFTDADKYPIAYVNNVGRLPIECQAGFKVRIRNTFTEEDDYYLEFINSIDKDSNGDPIQSDDSAQGYWEEIAKPGEPVSFDISTMPHCITRLEDGRFVSGRIDWKERTVGTAKEFNPSFVENFARISSVNFFKNRLILTSTGGTVVTSRSTDILDLFPITALTTSPDDPIDVRANNTKTTPLHDSIVTNNGLIVFGAEAQFQFFTVSDILSPSTVNITQVSSYQFEPNSIPQPLSTNISFVTSKGSTRMYEMTNVFDRGQVDVNERSKPIQSKFAKGYTHTSSSRIYNILGFSKPDAKDMWVYIYFKDSSQSDQQTAWVKFEFPDNVKHHFFNGKFFYVVTGNETECYLTKLPTEAFDGAAPDPEIMPEFIDYWYYADDLPEGQTEPFNYPSGAETVPSVFLPKSVTGFLYDSQLNLPQYYVSKGEQGQFRADTTASLTMHRYKINHGAVGAYHVEIKRDGKDDYTVLYEQPYQDLSTADFPAIAAEQEQTIPIYDRNTNIDFRIRSGYNLPCIIYSMRWEGDYNNRYYKRV